MKMLKVLLLASLMSHSLLSQNLKQDLANLGKLHVGFNKNIELLGFAYFIAFEGVDIENKTVEINGELLQKKEWHSYGYHFYNQYKGYAESENLNKSLAIADHLWLDYIINLLLQVEEFPKAKFKPSIDDKSYIRFSANKNLEEAKKNVAIFLDGLNEFYKEVKFNIYLSESEKFYETALKEVKQNLPNSTFINDLEWFYRRTYDSYTLIPSLTIPKGMGFGLRNNDGQIYNAFGAFDQQEIGDINNLILGFDNPQKINELSIHEFGHSFVNPALYKVNEEYISATSELFKPIKGAMANQGYNTWKASLYEHFVRAGEIMIAKESASPKDVDRLRKDYIETRAFLYIPIILKELEAYVEANSYPYEEAVNRSFVALKNLADSLPNSSKVSIFSTNPDDAHFHTEDIKRFWEVYDLTKPKFNGKIWQEEYIDKGSIGLKGFISNRIENGNQLAKTIKKNLRYYEDIRESSLSIDLQKEKFYKNFHKLKALYPHAVFPDVYFVIGRKNTGGTIFDKGLIIGAERFGKPNVNFQPDIDIDNLDNVISHELIHFQQNYVKDNTLLAQCIREGAADFLGEMISGSHTNKKTYEYGDVHEKVLWKEFINRKDGTNWYNWLYYSKDKSRPKDLGYWMGYKICKSYYQQMENKTKAIEDILNIRDFNEFLIKSGYSGN